MREFVGEANKRRTVTVDEIRKLLEQIVGEGRTWLDLGEPVPLFISDDSGNKGDGAGFPFYDSFRSRNGIQVLTGLLCERVQFGNLLSNGGQLLEAIRRHAWSVPSSRAAERSVLPK